MEEDQPSEINRNKRKLQDEVLEEVPVAKHTCLFSLQNQSDDIQLDLITNSSNSSTMSSAIDSNSCFLEDADSVMSVSRLLHADSTSSSSVNWSGACFESSEDTKTHDAISSSNMYTSPSFEEDFEYETKQLEEASMEDLLCSNAVVISNKSVLSSGRWNVVNQDAAEQGTEKLTIDKEFEQYFSMLML